MEDISGFIEIESDGRHTCIHAFEEEVDYEFYVSTNGNSILIPKWVDCPPMVICGRDGKPGTCTGCDCGHYVNAYAIADQDGHDSGTEESRD